MTCVYLLVSLPLFSFCYLLDETMVPTLVFVMWLRQQMVNGLRNIKLLDGQCKMLGWVSLAHSAHLCSAPASWTMSREGRAAFLKEKFAGAQHFDIDEVSDQSSPYPHMIPSPHLFQDLVAKVRVQSHTYIFIVTHFFQ